MTTASAAPIPALVPAPVPQPPRSYYAFVCLPSRTLPCLSPRTGSSPSGDDDSWLAACYRLTPRLERLAATRALLDLGACTAAEAHAAALGLLRHLEASSTQNMPSARGGRGRRVVRIGLGPSPLLAQLALLSAATATAAAAAAATAATAATATTSRDAAARIAAITPDTAPAVLRALPVRLLPRLHPAGAIGLETVERLERYGLRTLGQVARLGEAALRRQFGDRIGALLAAVAAGRDIRPLLPTPQPATRRFRLPFAPAAPPERALAALPTLARWIARYLADERLQAGTLRLLLAWESGAATSAQSHLRAPVHAADPLARHLQQLALTLTQADEAAGEEWDTTSPTALLDYADAADVAPTPDPQPIARIVVELADLRPLAESQGAFWETTARKRAALAELADTLARRYARPALLHAVCARPHAIFRAERYELRPLGDPAPDGNRTGWAADVAPAPGAHPGEQATAPWDAVPHRLHWW